MKRVPGRLTKALTLTLSGVFLVSAGILAGLSFSKQNVPAAPSPTIELSAVPEVIALTPEPTATPGQPSATPEADPASALEPVVAPGCKMTWATNFTMCGHSIEETRAERDLIGLTKAQVAAAVKAWTLESFSHDELKFGRSADMYCPDHLLLKGTDKGLGVYKTDLNTLELTEIMKFTLDISHLDRNVQADLEKGMPFDDLEEIEGYIENLES